MWSHPFVYLFNKDFSTSLKPDSNRYWVEHSAEDELDLCPECGQIQVCAIQNLVLDNNAAAAHPQHGHLATVNHSQQSPVYRPCVVHT